MYSHTYVTTDTVTMDGATLPHPPKQTCFLLRKVSLHFHGLTLLPALGQILSISPNMVIPQPYFHTQMSQILFTCLLVDGGCCFQFRTIAQGGRERLRLFE